jgi:glycosyltransferase involved in cell wall biosynthesis
MSSPAPLRCDHVIASIATEASGPSYSVPKLCEALQRSGWQAHLHVGGDRPSFDRWSVPIHWYRDDPLWPRRLGVATAMMRGLQAAVGQSSVLHNHGLWMMPNVYCGRVDLPRGCKLVVAPRGTLADWAWQRSRLQKAVLWRLGQARTLRRADLFHATSQDEAQSIRRRGFRQPIAIVPNGVDLPHLAVAQPHEPPYRLLFLGRIHPVKGIPELLEAWRRIHARHSQWQLHLCGPGDAEYLSQLRQQAASIDRVFWHPEVYGTKKEELYRSASLYVLPSHTENFGLTIAEALASGVPVIASRRTPWQGLETERCGWWVELGVDPLSQALEESMRLESAERFRMGKRGRKWIDDAFSWGALGESMAHCYRWLLGHEPIPSCVQLD